MPAAPARTAEAGSRRGRSSKMSVAPLRRRVLDQLGGLVTPDTILRW
jgi:hypothetical protein